MTLPSPLAPAVPVCGFAPDALSIHLDATGAATTRLIAATLNRHEGEALRLAIREARVADAAMVSQHEALSAALAPASEQKIHEEGLRLLRAWPQDRRGDLAGFGAELGIFLLERRPSRYGLAQACRTLKLTSDFVPTIAKVIGAIDQAEEALLGKVRTAQALPDRIARAERLLAPDSAPVRSPAPEAAA